METMEKAKVTGFSSPKDVERAKDLAAASHTDALGRARMQASLIKDPVKIKGRFAAMYSEFGVAHQITRIFANRLLELHRSTTMEVAFFEGAQDRAKGLAWDNKNAEKFTPVSQALYQIGWVMMDEKMTGK
jgi:hypothetical protein